MKAHWPITTQLKSVINPTVTCHFNPQTRFLLVPDSSHHLLLIPAHSICSPPLSLSFINFHISRPLLPQARNILYVRLLLYYSPDPISSCLPLSFLIVLSLCSLVHISYCSYGFYPDNSSPYPEPARSAIIVSHLLYASLLPPPAMYISPLWLVTRL